MLALGFTARETAAEVGIAMRTVFAWKSDPEFSAEVDRLTLMSDIANRAERLRIIMKVVRARTGEDGTLKTDKDVLDWIKLAQSETDGVRLNLAALLEAAEEPMARGRLDGPGAPESDQEN